MSVRVIYLIGFLFLVSNISSKVVLPRIFGDHMVLQREVYIPIWGTSTREAQVTLRLNSVEVKGTSDSKGKWNLRLPRMKSGGPYRLVVFEDLHPDDSVVVNDIWLGDVWLASGQSNMEMKVKEARNAKIEISRASHPKIRFFNVPHCKSITPQEDVQGGEWRICDSSSVKEVSAVAYYFARQINKEIDVPIGILQSTWGGTPVEAWTSKEALLSNTITRQKAIDNDTVKLSHYVKDSLDLIRFWNIVYHPQSSKEKSIPSIEFDDSLWQTIQMPSTLKTSSSPIYEGIVWLRKTVDIPADFSNQKVELNLGMPEMNYTLYVNGVEICKTVWNAAPTHSYTIPSKLLCKGKNTIVLRMAYLWGGGGFNPPATNFYISDGKTKIVLAGEWRYQYDLEPPLPKIYNYHYYPSFLFNGMIHPLLPYGLKGILWYQGEANDTAAYHYQQLFPLMINDWRIRWQQGYLPFYYVQLPNYKKRVPFPIESEWAEMREAQAMAEHLPNTGMVCAIDLGEANDIHPKNKQSVGYRLANIALSQLYGKSGITASPHCQKIKFEGNKVRVTFTHVDNGLTTNDRQPPREFTLAGIDRQFYRATAQVEGNEVVISCEKVPLPIALRYAWSDNPDVNLVNTEGFPVIPFRSDKWNGITQHTEF